MSWNPGSLLGQSQTILYVAVSTRVYRLHQTESLIHVKHLEDLCLPSHYVYIILITRNSPHAINERNSPGLDSEMTAEIPILAPIVGGVGTHHGIYTYTTQLWPILIISHILIEHRLAWYELQRLHNEADNRTLWPPTTLGFLGAPCKTHKVEK